MMSNIDVFKGSKKWIITKLKADRELWKISFNHDASILFLSNNTIWIDSDMGIDHIEINKEHVKITNQSLVMVCESKLTKSELEEIKTELKQLTESRLERV